MQLTFLCVGVFTHLAFLHFHLQKIIYFNILAILLYIFRNAFTIMILTLSIHKSCLNIAQQILLHTFPPFIIYVNNFTLNVLTFLLR